MVTGQLMRGCCSGVLEQGTVEAGFRVEAAIAMDDFTDHVLPSDMGRRDGVIL